VAVEPPVEAPGTSPVAGVDEALSASESPHETREKDTTVTRRVLTRSLLERTG
jgi:hypothetical protein